MGYSVVRSTLIDGQRIEIAYWADDDLYSVRIYDREGLLSGGVHHFHNLYAAEKFYQNRLSQLTSNTKRETQMWTRTEAELLELAKYDLRWLPARQRLLTAMLKERHRSIDSIRAIESERDSNAIRLMKASLLVENSHEA